MPMENTSSNSLGVQGLVDNPAPADQPKDGFESFAADYAAEEFSKTQAAARWARTQNPEAYAEAQKLSPGIPPEIAVRQMEILRNNSAMDLYKGIFEKSPQLRGYYANQPKKLAFAHPDELDQISGLNWIGSAASDAFHVGIVEFMASQARVRQAQGRPYPGDDALLQQYAAMQDRTFGARSWFEQGLTGLSRMTPQVMMMAKGGQTGAVVGGAAGAGIGSVVPAVGTAIGAAAGMSAGAVAGAYQTNYDFQRGLTMLDFENIKDENGNKIDPKTAEFAANIVGAGSAALDLVGLERIARVVPGAKSVMGLVTKDGMKQALKNPGVRGALTNFVKNIAGTSGTEITTEVLQQGLQVAAEASLKAQANSPDQVTWGDAGQELLDTAVQTAQVMSILGPFAAVTGLGADARQIYRSREAIKSFDRINNELADNEFIKRAPGEAAAAVDAQLDGKQVFIPAKEMVELFQGAGEDVYGPALPNWRQRVDEALKVDGDIPVSVGEYVAFLNQSPVKDPLRTLVRAEPGGYTTGEISEFMSAMDSMLKSQSEMAADTGTPIRAANGGTETPAYAPQIEALRKQLRQAFTQQTADFYTDIIGSHYNAMAARAGISAEELFNQRPLEIQFGDEAGPIDPQTLFQSSIRDTSPEFKNWFGNSVARDSNGQPLTVYHGTNANFDAFDASKSGSQTNAADAKSGFFFASNPGVASGYADTYNWYKDTRLGRILDKVTGGLYSRANEAVVNKFGQSAISKGGNVMPVNLRIENPLQIDLGGAEYNEKTFSEAITQAKQAGNDGVVFHNVVDTGFSGSDKSTDVYVAFDPAQVKSIFNQGSYDPADPNILNQDNRGSIRLLDDKAVINLFGKSDMSTLLHEFSHFFLENLKEMSKVSPDIAADYEAVKQALGIKDDKITRDQHEAFAKMGEAYFYKGKAPSKALERAFMAFKALLKTLYRNLKNLGGTISPEISEVFDRMLATEDQIDQKASDTAYAPLFKSAAEMGVSEEEYLKYNELVDNLLKDARAEATEKLVGSVERRTKGWQGRIYRELRDKAKEQLKDTPPYSHRTKLAEGRITIDVNKLAAKYSKAALKKFPANGLRVNGLDPQLAAELLGYPTADDMVHDFVTSPTLDEAATAAAKEEMVRRYEGNANQPEMLDAQVQQAMAQNGRVYALGLELQALSEKAGKDARASIAAQAAVKLARDTLWTKPVKDINQTVINSNLRKAASMKFAAAAKGDWQAAATHARRQMLAQAIANEAAKIMKAVDKVQTKAQKYMKLKKTSVDPAYVEQILALVGKYEFANVSKKNMKKREQIRDFIKRETDDGMVFLNLPERVLRDAVTVNYKELSPEDLLGIKDTIDNLEHLGRLKGRIKAKQASALFEDVKSQLVNQANKFPAKPVKMKTYSQEEKTRLGKVAEWHASLLKPEQIVRWLDMDNISGPFMEHIFQPIADAQSKQNELSLKYNDKIMKIFDDLDPEYMDEIVRVDALNTTMTREELYAIALNTGSESNRQKLLQGELWTDGQLEAVLTNLSGKDWERIQQVWNTLEGLWPEINSLYKRLTGVDLERVEPRGFVNIHGEFKGGYYPVVYDFKARRGRNLLEDTTPEDRVSADQLFQNEYLGYVGTNNKYTVKRTQAAKPIKLSLSALPGHIHTVIHDLAYREAVRGAYKLLWDPEVKKAIEQAQGAATYDQLQHWLRAVASERSFEEDPNTGLIRRLRMGTTMYGMGYRLTTALAQPLGFFNSMVYVKPSYIAQAIYQMGMNPFKTSQLVQEMSAEMRDRFNQQDRDIRDNVRKLGRGHSKIDWLRSHAFWLIGMVDKFVANATWLAAYNQSIVKEGLSHELALRKADSIVRLSQGTGHVKDMPKMMTSTELSKFFTMFYSFFASQYNMQVDLTRKTSADIHGGEWGRILSERLPQWIYLVVCPAIFGALISGQTPEDDENWAWWALKRAMLYPLNAVPLVRDVASAAQSGRDYQMTPMGRAFDSGLKAYGKLTHMDNVDEWDPKLVDAIRPTVEAASIATGLPTGQAVTSISALWQGLEKGDLKLKDAFVGRQGR